MQGLGVQPWGLRKAAGPGPHLSKRDVAAVPTWRASREVV